MIIDLKTHLKPKELAQALGNPRPGQTEPWAPLPSPAPEEDIFIYKMETPTKVWAYQTAEGHVDGYVCRFDIPGPGGVAGKQFRPRRYGRLNGREGWHWKGWGDDRPLYRLPLLLERPNAEVIITEGEKAADAAALLFPDMVAVTSMNGAQSPEKTNWTPLSGRTVVIAADNDDPGRRYGRTVSDLVIQAGAGKVLQLPPDRLGRWVWRDGQRIERDGPVPIGWDLADAVADGWTAETVDRQRQEPDFLVPFTAPDPVAAAGEEPNEASRFRVHQDGVYRRVESRGGDVTWEWLCSPLGVVAETRDADNGEWGRLLRVTDRDGHSKEWAMPMALLAGDGTAMRERLLSMGLVLAPGNAARDGLTRYISTAEPGEKARCVNRIGWHGSRFVLPTVTIGESDGERCLLQSSGAGDHAFRQNGTLEGWQAEVARYAIGNSRLIFSIAAAFAAPLIHLLGAESGGFNLRGPSSIGKSTSLVTAGSVWGGGGVKGYIKQWRATDNGLESVAVSHSDVLLCLDELSQIDARAAGAAAYMLANGAGKARAGRSGEARASAEWRTLFLSNGEIGIADKLAEDGKGRRAAAGQQVRVVDIPADAGVGLGLFETLHGFKSADGFARHLKTAATEQYGTAALAFLEKLVANREEATRTLREATKDLVAKHSPPGADGQVSRVAARFGMIAAAGELAAAMGILPWPGDTAVDGVAACFQAWLRSRGGIGASEAREIVARVRHFVGLHGAARFGPMGRNLPSDLDDVQEVRIVNRAGWRRMETGGAQRWEYLITPEVFREEVCAGLDMSLVHKVLIECGFLVPDSKGKPQSTHKPPGMGPMRLYRISGRILEGEENA